MSEKNRAADSILRHPARHRQRGVSLFIVMVILLLSLLVVLGALAVASLNESIVGNQSDAQRAYGAAEALLDAARLDILLNGRYCEGGKNSYFKDANGNAAGCTARYPVDNRNSTLPPIAMDTCSSSAPYEGICLSKSPSDSYFSTGNIDMNTNSTAQIWRNVPPNGAPNGIPYNNQYINAVQGKAVYSGGTSLTKTDSTATDNGIDGVYWVEIFQAGSAAMTPNPSLASSNAPPLPDSTYPYIFRITAMAGGLRKGIALAGGSGHSDATVSVLRVYYIPYPLSAAALKGA